MAIIGRADVEIHATTDRVAGELRDGLNRGMEGRGTESGKKFTKEFDKEASRGIESVAENIGETVSGIVGEAGNEAGTRFTSRFAAALSGLSRLRISTPDLKTARIEKQIDRVKARLDELNRQKANPTIDADIATVEGKIAQLSARLHDLNRQKVNPKVDADIAGVQAKISQVRSRLETLNSQRANPTIDADVAVVESKIARVEARLAELNRKEATPKVEADIGVAQGQLDKLYAQLLRIDDQRSNPKVDADIETAEAQLTKLQNQLTQLENKRTSPKIDADITVAETAIKKLQDQLEELRTRPTNVKVDADIAATMTQLAALEQKLEEVTRPAQLRLKINEQDFTQAIIHLSMVARAIRTLVLPVAVIGATPAIASLGDAAIQAAGALYLLPAAIGVAAVGIGTLTVGLSHLGEALGPAGTKAEIEKVNEALAKLAPQARATALEIRALGSTWSDLRLSVQGRMFQDVSDQVGPLASIYLPMLRTSMEQVAGGFNTAILSISEFLRSAHGISTVQTGMTNVSAATTTLTGVLAPLSRAFFEIFAVGSEYVGGFANRLVILSEHFANYIAQARQSGELNRIIEQGIDVLSDLGELLMNVGDILGTIFAAGTEAGGSFLNILVGVTGQVNAFLESPVGNDALVSLFRTIHETVAALLPGIMALGGALAESIIALEPVMPKLAEAFSALAIAGAPVFVMLAELAAVVLPPIIDLITRLAPLLGPIAAGFMAMYVSMSYIGAAIGVLKTVWTTVQLVTIAQKAWTAAVWLFNAAMAANPITLVVIAIAALVAALVIAWNTSETFRTAVTNAFNAVVDAVKAVGDWFARLPDMIGNAISAAGDWLSGLGTSAMDAANDVGTWIGGLPARVGEWLSGLGATIAEVSVNAWNKLVEGARTAGEGLMNWLAELPSNIAYGLGFLAGTLYQAAVDGWNNFTTGITTAFVATVAWFQALPGRIASFITGLGTTLYQNATDSWNRFQSGIATAFINTIAWFQELPGRIGSFLTGIGLALFDSASSSWEQFTAGLASAFINTVAWFQELPGRVGGFLAGLGVTLYQNATGAWGQFQSGLVSAFVATVAWFQSLPGKIAEFFVGAGTWLWQSGMDIIQGLISGLTSAVTNVISFFTGLVGSFLQGFKDALGISSPSTVFMQFGMDILQGLLNGLQAMVSVVMGFVAPFIAMFVAAWSAIGTFFTAQWENMKNHAMAVWTAISTFFTAALAAYQQMWTTIITAISTFWSSVWDAIRNYAIAVWNAISAFFSTALSAYQTLFTTVFNAVRTVFTTVWTAIQTFATSIWNAIYAFYQSGFTAYQTFFTTIWTAIQTFFSTIWTAIQNTATTIWNAIAAFFSSAFSAYQAFFTSIFTAVSNFWSAIWTAIQNAATTIWNAIAAFFTNAFNAYQAAFQAIWNSVSQFFTNTWNNIRTAAQTIWNAISSYLTNGLNTLRGVWDRVWNTISSGFTSVMNGIRSTADRIWNDINNRFRSGINLVIDAVNWPINKINSALSISIPTIPRLASGGTVTAEGRLPGQIGSLASGGTVHEEGRVNGLGGTRNDAVLTRLSREEHVWSAAEVRAAGGHDAVRRMRAQVMAGGPPTIAPGNLANAMAARRVSPDSLGGASVAQGVRRRQLMDKFRNLDDVGRPALAYGGVRPHVAAAGQEIERLFGRMPGGIGGVGSRPNASDHPLGLALDFMTLNNKGLGDRVAGHLMANSQRMAVKYLIWQQAINSGGGWKPMADRGSATANHYDHVHASFMASGAGVPMAGGLPAIDFGALFDAAAAALGLPESGRAMARQIMPDDPDWMDPMGVSFFDKAWTGFRAKAIELMEKAASAIAGLLGIGGGATGPVADQVRAVAAQYGWDQGAEWDAISRIIQKESSWDPSAANPNSSARGLFQKMESVHGPVEPTPGGQAQWGLNYIRSRYGTPTAALAFHERNGWYDSGGWLQPGVTVAHNNTGRPEAIIPDPMTSFEKSFRSIFQWLAPQLEDALRNGWDHVDHNSNFSWLGPQMIEAIRGGRDTFDEFVEKMGGERRLGGKLIDMFWDLPRWMRHNIAEAFPDIYRAIRTPQVDLVDTIRDFIPPPPLPPPPPVVLPPEVPEVVVPELPTGDIGVSFQDALRQFAPELSLALQAGAGDQVLFLSREIMGNEARLAAMSEAMGADIAPHLENIINSLDPPPPPPPVVIPQPSWLERQIEMLRQFAEANRHRASDATHRLDKLPWRLEDAFRDALPALDYAMGSSTTDINKVLSQHSTELLAWLQTRSAEEQTQILWALDGQRRSMEDVLAEAQVTVTPSTAETSSTMTITEGAFQVTINGNADSVTVDQLRDTLTAWGDEIIHQYEGRT